MHCGCLPTLNMGVWGCSMSPFLVENLSAGTMDTEALLRADSPEHSFVPASDRYAVVPGCHPKDSSAASMAVPEFKKARLDGVTHSNS